LTSVGPGLPEDSAIASDFQYQLPAAAFPLVLIILVGAIDNTVFGNSRAAHNSSSPMLNVDIYLNGDPDHTSAATNVATVTPMDDFVLGPL
tara:strand:- start:898 stop:1170 length:273 start_codon:yes stop_codon:yes gene_type:complete